jgi:hypothetical protein
LLTLSSECLDFLTGKDQLRLEKSQRTLCLLPLDLRREAAREPSSLGSLVTELPLERQKILPSMRMPPADQRQKDHRKAQHRMRLQPPLAIHPSDSTSLPSFGHP